MSDFSPIAAISTPHGKGGLAVIRMSGDGCVEIADRFFKARSGIKLSETKPNTAVYGDIYHEGDIIDSGITTVFRAPHSFTGEDTVEISCHGGIVLAYTVLESAFLSGCRPAEAGEFTKRAFVNGKLSLSQAEAVIELIDSGSREKLKLASAQSRGVLKKKVEELYNELAGLLASVFAYIDYPDEDLTDVTPKELRDRIADISAKTDMLMKTYRSGKAVCEGISTVIAGRPNTGKSSLLNLLLHEDRAIVTETAGTTRDTIEETASVGKVLLRLCDTAGIRGSEDEIEKIGIRRAWEKLNGAELILAVFDGSQEVSPEDRDIIGHLEEMKKRGAEIIPVINKSDLEQRFDISAVSGLGTPIKMSAKTGENAKLLSDTISELYVGGDINYDDTAVISNARQYSSLSEARKHLSDAEKALDAGFTQDVAGLDLELALSRLGELDGRQAASEITDQIFHRFCVGK